MHVWRYKSRNSLRLGVVFLVCVIPTTLEASCFLEILSSCFFTRGAERTEYVKKDFFGHYKK